MPVRGPCEHRERLRHRGTDRGGQPGRVHGQQQAIAFNTALDSRLCCRRSRLRQVQIAFTDDPEAPDEQRSSAGSKSHYALIPVAASADVWASPQTSRRSHLTITLFTRRSTSSSPPTWSQAWSTTSYDRRRPAADLLAGVKCANPGSRHRRSSIPARRRSARTAFRAFNLKRSTRHMCGPTPPA